MLHLIQQALFADECNDFCYAFALPEIGKNKWPIAALFFGISVTKRRRCMDEITHR